MIDRVVPDFHFAVSEEVVKNCPFELDGKEITSTDFLPTKKNPSDAAWDVRCAETSIIEMEDGRKTRGIALSPGCFFKMSLGIRVFIPQGWWLNVCPRSSTFAKENILALYGIVDSGFANTLSFLGAWLPDACKTLGNKKVVIEFGTRIAQILPHPQYQMSILNTSNTEIDEMFEKRADPRGIGGFGSSGRV